jgi:hypothetical protein
MVMKKLFLGLTLFLMPLFGKASHIVGGEFELIHLNGFQYRLNLVLYFDQLNGNPGALDNFVDANIFRMADNVRLQTIRMPLDSNSLVNYTQPECSNGELVTRRLFYTVLLTLDAGTYNHPQGYYVSWERCCRNYTINNIFSLDPTNNPTGWAGQTFYLEFPPVVKDGQPFVDSTPRLFPPLNDYACPYRPYYTDFGGVDDDGDSLVYSLVTPLSTRLPTAIPPPGPRPYPNVTWRSPYGPNNILNGSPDLRISRDGFLTVTPTNQGLFVFAVKVEEYRDGVKIGETRRDFQMLVVDACPVAQPPQIKGKKLADASFTYDESMSISFTGAVSDANRCIQVQVSDPDSESIQDNFQERVKIKAVAINFKKDLTSILPTVSNATLLNGSTVEFTICFPQCPLLYGGIAEIGIVAMDDACSLPLTDTLKVDVFVEPPPNNPPRFTSPTPVTSTLNEGDQQAWPYNAVDDDGDPLTFSVLTNGFSLAGAGMTVNTTSNVPGAIDGELKWDAYCDIYDFTQRTAFQVTVQVEDQDLCQIPNPAKAIYNLNVILPGNADPLIDSDLTANPTERKVAVTRRISEALNFIVTGKDLADNDLLVLSAYNGPVDSMKAPVTIATTPVSAKGLVATPAAWAIDCGDIDLTDKEKEEYNFRFIVVDNANKCRIYKADTLDVELTVLPPLNQPPQLSVVNGNAEMTSLTGDELVMTRGATINLMFTGTDADVSPTKDKLRLQLADQQGNVLPPPDYSFTPVEGVSPVQTSFTWTPDCSIFRGGVSEQVYTISFELLDDHCQTAKRDSLKLTLRVREIDGSDENFAPPNFVSPNGDGYNDYYAMEQLVPETGELKNILPNDNCSSRFEYVRIYNRWGKEVFRSSERDFKWFPDDTSNGVYYYTIKFSAKEYRGTLTVRY